MVTLLCAVAGVLYAPGAVLVAQAMRTVDRDLTEDAELLRAGDLDAERRAVVEAMNARMREILREGHEKVWGGFGRGLGVAAVIYGLIMGLLLAPFFEELIFTGLALNMLSRRLPLLLAVPAVSLLFVLAHVPAAGLSLQLLSVAVLGLLAVAARLLTGTWLASVAVHAVCNALVFASKVIIALTAFRHGVV